MGGGDPPETHSLYLVRSNVRVLEQLHSTPDGSEGWILSIQLAPRNAQMGTPGNQNTNNNKLPSLGVPVNADQRLRLVVEAVLERDHNTLEPISSVRRFLAALHASARFRPDEGGHFCHIKIVQSGINFVQYEEGRRLEAETESSKLPRVKRAREFSV